MRKELVGLWISVLLLLPQNIWHALDDTEEFIPAIRSAIGLSAVEYDKLF